MSAKTAIKIIMKVALALHAYKTISQRVRTLYIYIIHSHYQCSTLKLSKIQHEPAGRLREPAHPHSPRFKKHKIRFHRHARKFGGVYLSLSFAIGVSTSDFFSNLSRFSQFIDFSHVQLLQTVCVYE